MEQELTITQRYVICIAGALLPSILEGYRLGARLLITELQIAEVATPKFYALGVACRLIILIVCATMYCYFFAQDETNKVRLFFDGMAAPSMLITITAPIAQSNNLFGV